MLTWSSQAASSRQLCMESCGAPMSTVFMPVRLAWMGPTVEPQGMSLRETNVWQGILWSWHSFLMSASPSASVA